MSEWELETPVVLFIFKRPETTRKVFKSISEVQPSQLFIVADGPREDNENEVQKCHEARDIINVDWECQVQREYSDENLGLRQRIPSGLNWVFSQVDEAIILEDDCLPSQDFFRFCSFMLDKYRDNSRVMDISGTNYLTEWKSEVQDYHFSVYGGIWGWATWKNTWEMYDSDMPEWEDKEAKECVRNFLADDKQFRWRKGLYDKTRKGTIETWAYQWTFYRLLNTSLSVVPSKNLVSNIGFGSDATHTNSPTSYANLHRHELDFPIQLRNYTVPDRDYDQQFYKLLSDYPYGTLKKFAKNILKTTGLYNKYQQLRYQ